MTESILSYPDLISDLGHEADVLKTGLDLLESTFEFNCADEAAASAAQQRLYFIAGALSESQKRFQEVAAHLAVHADALRQQRREARNQEGVAA
ncbi:MAG: hypothetical protein Q8N48_00205 [Thiobacillus sp.]|nr:hypothetical protein [Thiobacillus sp.]MDP2977233.1 hypothetical protein [Thiobacillus sp.]